MSTKRLLGNTTKFAGVTTLGAFALVSHVHTTITSPIASIACLVGGGTCVGIGTYMLLDDDNDRYRSDGPTVNVTGK